MAREGMDVDAVSAHVSQLGNIVNQQLPTLINEIDREFNQIAGAWHGPDARHFVSAWNGNDKPGLTKVQHELNQVHMVMNSELSQQRQTSAPGTV